MFAGGAVFERADESAGGHVTDPPSETEQAGGEAAEEGGHTEEAGHADGEEVGHAEPTVLGINLEDPALIALGVLVSIVAAAAVFRSDASSLLGGIALFSATFGALDLWEAGRQAGDDVVLLTVAASAGLAHAAAALIAVRTLAARC